MTPTSAILKYAGGCHVKRWLLRGLFAAVLLAVAGCTYTDRRPVAGPRATNATLIGIAVDPMRPLHDRMAAAERLDAAGRAELEAALLNDMPTIWGLELQHRLHLLGAIGSEQSVQGLQAYAQRPGVPANAQIRSAVAETVTEIQSRLGAASNTLPREVDQDKDS